MKYISKILATLLFVSIVSSCVEEVFVHENTNDVEVGVYGDEIKLNLNFVAPDPVLMATRAVDPDGKTLQNLTLFCFDANGLFLTTATAQVKGNSDDNLSGTFGATIPKTTRIIHLLANQNMSSFEKNDYLYRTEDDVLSALEGSAGMMIYWARIQAPLNLSELYTNAQYTIEHDGKTIAARTDAEAFVDWITIETNPASESHRGVPGKNNPIVFLRNQAKFTILSEGDGSDPNDDWKGDAFEVTGFAVCNSYAFGTVAPYHVDYGFPTYACSTFTPEFGVVSGNGVAHNWLDEKKVTLAARKDKMSDIVDVSNARENYIFESGNLGTDPVDLILRGRNIVNGVPEEERYYYRVNILDTEGEMVEILRNHHYVIHIDGNLRNGCATFNEALVSPPTNNVWVSISDEVSSVRNNSYELSIETTKVVVEAGMDDGQPEMSELKLKFNVRDLTGGSEPINPEKIKVYWLDDDQKVSRTFFAPVQTAGGETYVDGTKVTFDVATGDGAVTLALNKLLDGSEYERASLVVKYGNLQRKIRILLMRTKKFTPTWVSAEVFGTVTGDVSSRSNVYVIFTIPETCPEELFPMDVLVTTNGLDGRSATGQVLPIVSRGEEGYGKEFETIAPDGTKVTDIGYKYKFTVTEPGQKTLYFENIVNMEDKDTEYVTIEADQFEMVTKLVTYVNYQDEIVLPNLLQYSVNPGAAEEENVKYILVPQKRFAPLPLDVSLRVGGNTFGTLSNEEFLLYSSNLVNYADDDQRLAESGADYNLYEHLTGAFFRNDFDCYFKPYAQSLWQSGGRIFGFYFREEKVDNATVIDDKGNFQIFMETNKPNSAEIIRIASNQKNSTSVISDRFLYYGRTFRSVTFELANYRPFRFAAQVNGEGSYQTDADNVTPQSEVVDNIQFEYLPDEVVAVSFDVTSFSVKNESNDLISIDPFGHAFEIFIDAPMLKLEKGMNKVYDGTSRDFEDVSVTMFDKDASGKGYTETKPKLEDLGNGRFVYRVHAKNFDEYSYWGDAVPLIQDEYYNFPLAGERKTIYFKKKSIVNSGKIVVSANPNHVTYHSKTFNVSSAPITGSIKYKTAGGEALVIPEDQFVSFTRIQDGSRIGSLTVKDVKADGTNYELRLRAEYQFKWTNDPIEVISQIDGKYYSAEVTDLATLYNSPDILLELIPDQQ